MLTPDDRTPTERATDRAFDAIHDNHDFNRAAVMSETWVPMYPGAGPLEAGEWCRIIERVCRK